MDRMDQDSHFVLSQPPQVLISRLQSYDSSYEDRKLNKHIKEYILRIQGGSNDNSNDDIEELNRMEQLQTSIISKTKKSLPKKLSINKILQRIFRIIDPVISRQEFWKILKLLEIPTEFESSEPNQVKWSEPSKKSERATKKSSLFAEAFLVPPPDKKHYWISPMTNNSIENSFSHGLTASGISTNHSLLGEESQNIEIKTRLRRAQPLYPSEVLGDSYQYGGKQLERKAPRHLPDFGISTEGKSLEEMASEYKNLVETILGKQDLVTREDGTLNKQEPTINIGDPETFGIVVFEKNPLYDNHHFITSYPVSKEAFEYFEETGNIGLSPEEREAEINELQRLQAKAEREKEKENARSFYSSLPEDARISNEQLREVEDLKTELEVDPNFELTDNQEKLLKRAENYQRHKTEFEKNQNKKDEL